MQRELRMKSVMRRTPRRRMNRLFLSQRKLSFTI
jgi:hypothetical protein